MAIISFQLPLRPALPNVYGPLDYRQERELFVRMDAVLQQADVELPRIMALLTERGGPLRDQIILRHMHGLRCGIARRLCGLAYREFAIRLADSALLQWFTRCGDFAPVKPCSKSSLERYDALYEVESLCAMSDGLLRGAAAEDPARRLGGLNEPLNLDTLFADCTCVEAHIHFPVDWVLLRDAVRTLTKAIELIRREGVKKRMPEPSGFLRRINTLSMEMSAARHHPESKKMRKQTLRKMKRLNRVVERHARAYRTLLDAEWEQTSWSRQQAEQVLGRMDNILAQLPQAIHQAHERIIGERRVDNAEKILSLYEPDAHVVVRGKAGAEVEFGNKLYLAEQCDGVIVDWRLFQGAPPSDSTLVAESVARVGRAHGAVKAFVADRGFDRRANDALLEELDIRNGVCPRNPVRMEERRKDAWFAAAQRRRAGTEARVGIFKNVFLGSPLRAKGFAHREQSVAWCVLAHNLWMLARKSLSEEAGRNKAAAA